MKKRVGIYVGHGVEMRHFVLSGLTRELEKQRCEVVLLLDKSIESSFFQEYIDKYNLKTILLDTQLANYPASKWEGRLRSMRDARKRYSDEPKYRHYGGSKSTGKIVQLISRYRLLYKWVLKFGIKKIHKHYQDPNLKDSIAGLDLNRLIILQYGTRIKTCLSVIGTTLGIRVDIFLNTLKTPYINDILTFRPNNLYCWLDEHAESYENINWYHKPNFANAKGSPFHAYLKQKNTEEINKVSQKYQIGDKKRLILYSMIFEKVYPNEHLIIENIYNALNAAYTKEERPLLALRRNPFEESDDGINYLKKNCPKIIVCDHYWERNAASGWSIQGLQGETEWRALLHRSNVLLNIPSMSTIDAMMTQTPTLNIFFNERNKYNKDLEYILESPFSKLFSNHLSVKKVEGAKSVADLFKRNFPFFEPMVNHSNIKDFAE